MGWTVPAARHEPTGDPAALVTVDDAVVTRYGRGPLRVESGPQRWIRGAVHDAHGVLVPTSQRLWNGDRMSPIAADPDVVPIPKNAARLEGTWLYAGHWAGHFGHFLLEMLPNLWPDPAAVGPLAGVVTHRPPRGIDRHPMRPLQAEAMTTWQRDLLALTGYDPDAVQVVRGRPLRVDRLLVPARPVLLKRWAAPPAVRLWQRVSDAVGSRGPHQRVYLSRTQFHTQAAERRVRTEPDQDDRLDAAFAAAGFAVVHPETLSVAEQIALVRGADVLAGLSGSGLHLSVFAAPGTRVLTLGDRRSSESPTKAQAMLDAACRHRTAFVAHGDDAALEAVLGSL